MLETLISTQKVTLFYWGQDRYINFLPFVFSWISDVKVNMLAIILTSGASYFLLLELISDTTARLLNPTRRGAFRLLMFFFLVLASLLVLNKPGLYTYAYGAQPYSVSYLLFGWTWLLLLKDKLTWWDGCGIGLFLLISMGLNPSILIAAIVSAMAIFSFDKRVKCFWVPLLALLWFIVWRGLGATVGLDDDSHYGRFSPTSIVSGAEASLLIYEDKTGRLAGSAILFVVALTLGFFVSNHTTEPKVNRVLWSLWLFGLAWWLVFVTNAWVERNLFHYRYFFPTVMIVIIFISLRLTQVTFSLATTVRWTMLPVLVAAIGSLVVVPYVPIGSYRDLMLYVDAEKYVQQKQASIVAGDYWSAWPVVFRVLMNGTLATVAGSRASPVYGAAFRGIVNMPEMDSLIVQQNRVGQRTRAVCIGVDDEECLRQLGNSTSFHWRLLEKGDCHALCYLYEVRPDIPLITMVADADLVIGLGLSMSAVTKGSTLDARLLLRNRTGAVFSSRTTKGPIRLSWRYVSVDEDGTALSTPTFDARKDLHFALNDGESYEIRMQSETPVKAGNYRFEATLVQEGVAWFQDLGMKIPFVAVTVQ